MVKFTEILKKKFKSEKKIDSLCNEFIGLRDEEFFYPEPREELVRKAGKIAGIEMSRQESAFLCGLLKKAKPGKIVEIGVAAGGTTAILQECFALMEHSCELYSVDKSAEYYRDKSLKTGFLAENLLKTNRFVKHKFLTGRVLPEVIDSIGSDIDFIILDTVHRAPGEILDFLCILPYLKDNAVVVVHDIAASLTWGDYRTYATSLLFTAISGEKYYPFDYASENPINIAAIKINKLTRDNIFDCFFALSLPWHHKLSGSEAECYKTNIRKNYPKKLSQYFDYLLAKGNK